MANGGNGNVWKWIAAILVTILLAGLPGIVHAYLSPTRDEVELIRERQNTVLQRLAGLDVQVAQLQAELIELHADLMQHEQEQRQGGR